MKNKRTNIVCAIQMGASFVFAQEKVQVKIDYPKPGFGGLTFEVKDYPFLDPYPNDKPRPPIEVPIGCDKLLSRGCKVTSSDDDPIIGELSYITDGDKNYDAATYVELKQGLQWIQIDLGSEKEIYAVCVWHHWGEYFPGFRTGRIYRSVICQISNDPEFVDGVVTVFNNDHRNLAQLGKATDLEYFESRYGRPFAVDAVKGRYVRFYSHGNNRNAMNHYTEVEVYGRSVEEAQRAEADNAEVRRKKAEQ